MKVNISYSIELEEIPGKIKEFITKAHKKSTGIEAGLKYVSSLMADDSSIQSQLEQIDEVRRKLADIDHILLDCNDILHGYERALVQLREPQLPTEGSHDDETRNEEIKKG